MKTTVIISEFNPFHNGHKFLINTIKNNNKNSNIISIMSGNFVERGGPAILPKHCRTKHALECGCDLVIELPFVYAHSTAEMFAFGAIKHLNQINVDSISFGCETPDIKLLTKIAELLVSPTENFNKYLKQHLSDGASFAIARSNAILNELGKQAFEVISKSNNILAIEYIKQIILTNSTIVLNPIKRVGSDYNDTVLSSNSFSSASAIREALLKNIFKQISNNVPLCTFESLKEYFISSDYFHKLDSLFNSIKLQVLRDGEISFTNIPDVVEGLENRIYKEILNSNTFEQAISQIGTKRYTNSRIRRILFNYLIGYTKDDFELIKNSSTDPYIRVLGSNTNGFKLLKQFKSNENITIINNLKELNNSLTPETSRIRELEIISTNIYNTLFEQLSNKHEYSLNPIIIND